MPELPEVETVRKSLERLYLNHKVTKVDILLPRMIQSPVDEFISKVEGSTFTSFRRVGKYLILDLDNDYSIISHLRMEGKYIQRKADEDIISHTRVVFHLDNGNKMCYDDSRSFGIMILCKKDEVMSQKEIAKLGPEPFSIDDPLYLYNAYQKKNNEIKICLLDQEIMTGLGNIYCDEVLFKAKINPYRKANTITLEECSLILKYSKETLLHAIELGGSTVSSYHPEKGVDGRFQNELFAYGKEGCKCVVCASIMRKDRLGGRGTTYCPTCQHVSRTIGLTGKIASGKSTALNYLKEKGYPIFSSDEEVTRLYSKVEVKKKLVEIFGEAVLNDNLTISKGYIKNVIVEDTNKKVELENYIHPLVKEAIIAFIKKNKTAELTIIEVPLMFEKRIYTLFDYILGVTCSYSNQITHLNNRKAKNVNTDMLLGQSNSFDKNVGKCHFLINNDTSLESFKNQIDDIIVQIKNS